MRDRETNFAVDGTAPDQAVDYSAYQDEQFDRVVLRSASDVATALADRTLSVDPFAARPTAYHRLLTAHTKPGRQTFMLMDDPDHARLRGLTTQAFNARAVEAMRPRIERIADDLLDEIGDAPSFELMAAYAAPLPVLVIADMLGIDDADVADFKQWSDSLALIFLPDRTPQQDEELLDAAARLNDSLTAAIVRRRSTPGQDLIGRLVAAEMDDHRLNDREVLDTCRLLLTAGNLTTTDLIGNGVVALLRHPDQLERLRRDPARWPDAVEEVLRYDSSVKTTSRVALSDTRIGGCPVAKGQSMTLMLSIANHDPSAHPAASDFDIDRPDKRHWSFGGGAHFCLGAPLARLEAEVALSKLFARHPTLDIADKDALHRKRNPAFSGYQAIRLTSAARGGRADRSADARAAEHGSRTSLTR